MFFIHSDLSKLEYHLPRVVLPIIFENRNKLGETIQAAI
jgi:hypothetical protein